MPYWTEEETVQFEKGLDMFGKRFHLIAQQVGSKSVSNCVRFYYEWKKTRKVDEVIATFVYPIPPTIEDGSSAEAMDAMNARKNRKSSFRPGGHNICGNCGLTEETAEFWPFRGWNVAHLCKVCRLLFYLLLVFWFWIVHRWMMAALRRTLARVGP